MTIDKIDRWLAFSVRISFVGGIDILGLAIQKNLKRLLIGLFSLIVVVFCAEADEGGTLTLTQWSEDIDYLLSEIKSRNPDIFDRIEEREFKLRAESLRSIGANLSTHQRAMRLAELIASLQQTHSYIDLTAPNSSLFSKTFGFELNLFEEGFYVTCVAKGHEELFGKKVILLGGQDPARLHDAVSKLSGADNPWLYRILVARRMNVVAILRELGALDDGDTLKITLMDGADIRTTDVLRPTENDECYDLRDSEVLSSAPYWKNVETPYWAEILPHEQTVYFQFNAVVEGSEPTYAEFADQLLQMFVNDNPTRIIIDLRRNIGGNAVPARKISSAILQHTPFQRPGAIVVLTSAETLSASVVFAQELSLFAPVTLIGEPTGSNDNQWGDNQFFDLPNSHLTVSIATAFYQTGGPYGKRQPLLPYNYIPNRAMSFFAVRDPILKRALKFSPDPSVEDVFNGAQEQSIDPIAALSEFVLDPQRRFQDLERPLRLLSREVLQNSGAAAALKVNNLLVDKHSDRARSFMERASTHEVLGQLGKAIADWEKANQLIDHDISLTPPLRLRLRRHALEEINRPHMDNERIANGHFGPQSAVHGELIFVSNDD